MRKCYTRSDNHEWESKPQPASLHLVQRLIQDGLQAHRVLRNRHVVRVGAVGIPSSTSSPAQFELDDKSIGYVRRNQWVHLLDDVRNVLGRMAKRPRPNKCLGCSGLSAAFCVSCGGKTPHAPEPLRVLVCSDTDIFAVALRSAGIPCVESTDPGTTCQLTINPVGQGRGIPRTGAIGLGHEISDLLWPLIDELPMNVARVEGFHVRLDLRYPYVPNLSNPCPETAITERTGVGDTPEPKQPSRIVFYTNSGTWTTK